MNTRAKRVIFMSRVQCDTVGGQNEEDKGEIVVA